MSSLLKKQVDLPAIDPFYRKLLTNRDSTTNMVEELTQAVLSARAVNRINGFSLDRSAVLTGNGVGLILAGSKINLSAFPLSARLQLLASRIPLGKILEKYHLESHRKNFRYFKVPGHKRIAWFVGEEEYYFCRTYEIYNGNRRIARIEELFSPHINNHRIIG